MPEETIIRYRTADGKHQKVRYRNASLTDPPERTEWVWNGCGWRFVGTEPVSDLHID